MQATVFLRAPPVNVASTTASATAKRQHYLVSTLGHITSPESAKSFQNTYDWHLGVKADVKHAYTTAPCRRRISAHTTNANRSSIKHAMRVSLRKRDEIVPNVNLQGLVFNLEYEFYPFFSVHSPKN